MRRRALAILREEVFSPGKVDPDAAILREVAAGLARHGYDVRLVRGEALADEPEPLVLAMCQGAAALEILDRWAGARIVNPPAAIRNCYRRAMIPLLEGAGVGLPATRTLPVGEAGANLPRGAAWIKRGDVHATDPGDVAFAGTPGDARRALDALRRRGVGHVCIQEHVPGRTVKFYAVADGSFFRTVDPAPIRFDAGEARETALKAGRALGLEVFGGDFQVSPEGRIHVVDVNDWPSFSRCRDEAAGAIAGYVRRF